MRASGITVLSAVVCAVAFTLGAAAIAGTPSRSSPTPTSPSQQGFSEEALRKFAIAIVEVQRIGETYRPQLQAAKSAEQRQTLQSQAVDEMVTAVSETGLSVESYNEIHRAARTDPKLASQIDEYMRKAR